MEGGTSDPVGEIVAVYPLEDEYGQSYAIALVDEEAEAPNDIACVDSRKLFELSSSFLPRQLVRLVDDLADDCALELNVARSVGRPHPTPTDERFDDEPATAQGCAGLEFGGPDSPIHDDIVRVSPKPATEPTHWRWARIALRRNREAVGIDPEAKLGGCGARVTPRDDAREQHPALIRRACRAVISGR
jgi:hypothetical protein